MGNPELKSDGASLPSLYSPWLLVALGGSVPVESAADCSRCVMLSGPSDDSEAPTFFSRETVCCTFYPNLPNFVAGRILLDESPSSERGRTHLRERIDAGVGVTPLGVQRPRAYSLLYAHRGATFGRAKALRCPFLSHDAATSCGIWSHRISTCATWFCKHMRGARGHRFWLCVRDLLSVVERDLSIHCALEAGLDAARLGRVLPHPGPTDGQLELRVEDLDAKPDSTRRRDTWGDLLGKEAAFFEECARLAESLSWHEVLGCGSPELRARLLIAQEAYRELLSPALLQSLVLGRFTIRAPGGDVLRLVSYSERDALEVPRRLVEVLPAFDGRPLDEVLLELRAECGLELDEELVGLLVDFEILVPAER